MKYIVEISYVASSKFCGWQIQKNKPTYQQVCEDVFSKVLGAKTSIVASGRTDSGVSAIRQVGHFETNVDIPNNFVGHVNSLLPEEIKVLSVNNIDEKFHARFDAKRKTYKYYFYQSKTKIPFYDKFALHVTNKMDFDLMVSQAQLLIGLHDFKSFCATGSEVKDFVRTIYSVDLKKSGDLYEFTICGNGFLYNMVRIIVGTLIDIGSGKIQRSLDEIIESRNRTCAGKTVGPEGLVLVDVCY